MSKTSELVFAAVMFAASLFLLHRAYSISGIEGWDAAGTIPMLATGAMSATLLAVLTQALAGWLHEAPPAGGRNSISARLRAAIGALLPLNLVALVALFVAYVAALAWVGFYPATLGFVTLAIIFLERGRPFFAAAIAVVAIAGIYGAFETFFQVRLP